MTARVTAGECGREAQKCIDESTKTHASFGVSADWLVLAELWTRMAEALTIEEGHPPADDARSRPPSMHHWAIDCRASGLLSYGCVEDFVIDDFSGAPLSHRWCDGYLLKLQASRRYSFNRQARQAIRLVL
jgi:hypothetical protein